MALHICPQAVLLFKCWVHSKATTWLKTKAAFAQVNIRDGSFSKGCIYLLHSKAVLGRACTAGGTDNRSRLLSWLLLDRCCALCELKRPALMQSMAPAIAWIKSSRVTARGPEEARLLGGTGYRSNVNII